MRGLLAGLTLVAAVIGMFVLGIGISLVLWYLITLLIINVMQLLSLDASLLADNQAMIVVSLTIAGILLRGITKR
ncbi:MULTISPECIES: hypothetical protein [unclassified Exiguobacterium]|uniref:hypothetical protein n=1 Tax=unclassified Exiguobacterium TaxID=2644629 RepID=UPI001BEB44E9|nr:MULTISPECIES: hypothetical protein [unclassified Exiguobacterium]